MSNFNDYRPSMTDTTFSNLSDDVTLKIFFLLEDDPRHWARLSCACKKFNSLISSVCCRSKCLSSFPSVSADLLSASSSDGWASLLKNAVCCPGLLHAGVLLDNSDFGLGREIGDTVDFLQLQTLTQPETETEDEYNSNLIVNDNQIHNTNKISNSLISSSLEPTAEPDDTQTRILSDIKPSFDYTEVEDGGDDNSLLLSSSSSESTAKADGSKTRILTDINTTSDYTEVVEDDGANNNNTEFGGWSLYDDLYYDTVYDFSEAETPTEVTTSVENLDYEIAVTGNESNEMAAAKRRKVSRLQRSHLASGVWNLSREQGNKLLASRFRDDCLYISEWPGCVHIEDKRNYMLFRGVFKNFKRTRVWRTINDGNRSSVDLNCAFCSCKETWDLHSAFCLKRGFGFHDDGEPVVRAYVCENGHVSGAWTDLPLYT